jgi:RecA-family ATPase
MSVERGPWPERNQPSLEEFAPFSPAKRWEGHTARPLDWMVDGAFLRGTVAILAGDGGLGKSLLLQQLITAAAHGLNWLGMRTEKCRSLAVFCEDDVDELHRRQEAINRHYGLNMGNLEAVQMESRPGRDCTLMQFDKWGSNGRETPMMSQLRYAAKQHQAKIVVLDTLADVFSGNEVDRNQPRTFIRALRKLAIELQGVVILTQHPSVEGMASGSGRSGSTGWHNSVRSRLYLTMPKRKANEEDTPTNERWLKTMKNNQGKWGGKTSVTWEKGVFRLTEQQATWTEDEWG